MRAALACLLSLALLNPAPVSAYSFVEFMTPSGTEARLQWGTRSLPVRFFVNNRQPRDFTLQQMIDASQASFTTWQDVPTAGVSFQYGGTTAARPFVFFDFVNTLGFTSDPELEGTGILGATSWIIFVNTGEIAESDIFFNNQFPWSVAAGGTAGRFDYQSVATHEIGHFHGLGHSGMGVMETVSGRSTLLEGSAIMWPFAFPRGTTTGRALTPDDVAGASVNYPEGSFTRDTGSLSGRVTKNGRGLLGVNVIAFNPFSGETIGRFTGRDGSYRIEGLKPGPYIVRVNPIKAPTSGENFNFDESALDLDFRDELFIGRVEVRPTQTTPNVDFEVVP